MASLLTGATEAPSEAREGVKGSNWCAHPAGGCVGTRRVRPSKRRRSDPRIDASRSVGQARTADPIGLYGLRNRRVTSTI